MFKIRVNLLFIIMMLFGSVNLYAEEEVAVSEADATKYVNDMKDNNTTNSLLSYLENLISDVNNPTKREFYINGVEKELTTMIYGTITTLGVTSINKKVVGLSVSETFKEVIKKTKIFGGPTNGFKSYSKGLIIGIIGDMTKDIVEKIIYKETNNRVLSGASVILIEQGLIYGFSGGLPHKILVAEAELFFSRVWDIGSTLYEVDKIQNQTAHNSFKNDLLIIQVKYTKEFCQSWDKNPNQNLINRLNQEVDNRVEFYSDEIDLSEVGTAFKNGIYDKLVAHKLSYRYLALNRLKENRDEIRYFKYLNNYFRRDERAYYKHDYSEEEPFYSDIDIKSQLHRILFNLIINHKVSYVQTTKNLYPYQNIEGSELNGWFQILMRKIEIIDDKNYNQDIFLLPESKNVTYLDFAMAVDAFYKEVYNSNSYDTCLTPIRARVRAKYDIHFKFKELGYDIRGEERELGYALKRYYSMAYAGKFDNLYINLNLTDFVKRKELITFGESLLNNHQTSKKLIQSCKE